MTRARNTDFRTRRHRKSEHAVAVLARHLRPHPNLPGRFVPCHCDLCRHCRTLPVG